MVPQVLPTWHRAAVARLQARTIARGVLWGLLLVVVERAALGGIEIVVAAGHVVRGFGACGRCGTCRVAELQESGRYVQELWSSS